MLASSFGLDGVTTCALAVIGHPIHHSVSPKLHAHFAHEMCASSLVSTHPQSVQYEAEQVIPEVLEAWFEELKASHRLQGFNVTIPHKQTIVSLLDTLTPEAELMGAVNTVKWDATAGVWIGHNTDGLGAWLAMPPAMQQGLLTGSGHAVFLGVGGSARAVATTLVMQGVKRFTLIARDLKKAEQLKQQLQVAQCHTAQRGDTPIRVELLLWPKTSGMWTSVLRHLDAQSTLIQTTPMGMMSYEGDTTPIPEEAWEALSHMLDEHATRPSVFDLIYNPLQTPLMTHAQRAGVPLVHHGLGMLVMQGALAFEYWTGYTPLILQDARQGVTLEKPIWEDYEALLCPSSSPASRPIMPSVLSQEGAC